MKNHKPIDRVISSLQAISSWDYKIAIGVATSTVIINVFLLAYRAWDVGGQGHFEFSPGIYISGNSFFYTLHTVRLIITIALLMAAGGLWLRRSASFLLSVAALVSIFVTYAWWYFDTIAYLRNTEVTEHTKLTNPFYKEMGLLHGATPWDWAVLIIALVLFIWEIKLLSRTFVSYRSKQIDSNLRSFLNEPNGH